MPTFVRFETVTGTAYYVNPDHVVSVHTIDNTAGPTTIITLITNTHFAVADSAETVVVRLGQGAAH